MFLNWPEAAVILGGTGIAVFRSPLARLIERTEKVRGWLVAPKQPTLPAESDQTLPTRNREEEQRGLEELTKGFDNALLLIQEDASRADLAKAKLLVETGTEKTLLRHLAGTQIALAFSELYRLIYRSQLEALRWLNSQPTEVHSNALVPFYEDGKNKWPSLYTDRDFRSWLFFLAARSLITESDESRATPDDEPPFGIQITVTGRAFLSYLVNYGLTDPVIG